MPHTRLLTGKVLGFAAISLFLLGISLTSAQKAAAAGFTLSNSGTSTVTQGTSVNNTIGVSISGGGSSAISFVQEAYAQNGNNITSLSVTPTNNVAAGDEMVLHVNVRNGPGTTVTDNQGDVWTRQISNNYASDGYLEVWTAPVKNAGTKPVVTVSQASGGFITLELLEYSGVNTASPIDVSAQNHATGGGTISAGATAAISGSNELGIVVASGDGAGTFTVSAGFTQRSNQAPVPVVGIPMAAAEKAVASGAFTGTYQVDFAAYGIIGYVLKPGSSSVSLSSSGLPSGVSAIFAPSSCSVTCTSTSTISTLASTAPGTYAITVTGTAGTTTATTNFNLVVNTPVPDTTPPSVPTNLTASNVTANSLTVSWNASTDNVGVAGYKVFRNAVQVGTTTSGTSFADSNLAVKTSYTYTASAYDAAGNVSAQSAPLVVSTLQDTTAPTVAVTAPTTGSIVLGHMVTVSATATDDVGVASVQFQVDGTNVGSPVTTAPYAIVWDSTTVADGPHTITAAASDAAGNVGTSSVTITVNNTTPQVGTWVNVSPAGVSTNPNNPSGNFGFQSMAIDPQNPSTVYVGTDYQGLYKTNNSGVSWFRVDTTPNLFTTGRLWCLAIDNFNPNTLYACDGYGIPQGVFKSTDGGATWTEMMPASLFSQTSADIYSIATDPYMANHILVAFHSGWNGGSNSGVIESFDGGNTWTVHNPTAAWGAGNYISFLNNSSTWLLSTQGDGFWKTTDGGNTWTQVVSNYNMQHGAEQVYHSSVNNAWYMGAVGTLLRSTDNGSTWSPVAPVVGPDGYNAVIGDGVNLYTQSANTGANSTGPNSYITSPEAGGTQWATQNSQTFSDGPMSMVYDPVNHYVYSSNWGAGVWRLKTGSATTSPDTVPPSAPSNLAAVATSTSNIALSWSASTDNVGVAGYKIYRNGIFLATTTALSYNDTALTASTTYTYGVSAFDAAGNVSATSTIQATTMPQPDRSAPSLPTNFTATTLSSTSIKLTWTASTDNVGVTGYLLFRNGAYLATATSTSYTDTGLASGTTYLYGITAIDAAGNIAGLPSAGAVAQ